MIVQSTEFEGLFILEPRVFADSRGYFFESYKEDLLKQSGLAFNWIQDNEAKSNKGALRGLHYQLNPMAQSKLVRVITGAVLDVVVDIRPDSTSYGQHYKIILSGENKRQLLVPRGFAHGYYVLEDDTVFSYKCDNYYSKELEAGIQYDDPTLAIDWNIKGTVLVSDKDMRQAKFGSHKKFI